MPGKAKSTTVEEKPAAVSEWENHEGNASASQTELVAVSNVEVLKSYSNRQDRVTQATSLSDLREVFGSTLDWQEIEPSFTIVDKDVFEGKPCVIGAFRFNQSKQYTQKSPNGEVDIPSEFVSMLVARYDPQTEEILPAGVYSQTTGLMPTWVVVNDGSAGINQQLERYARRFDEDVHVGARKAPPLRASAGFRKSSYPVETEDGMITGVTWYIA